MTRARPLVVGALLVIACVVVYSIAEPLLPFSPIRQSLRAIRSYFAQLDPINAKQIQNETQPLVDKAKEEERLPPTAEIRNNILPQAQRTQGLAQAYEDANAIANGRRADGIRESVVPPPPPPPPIQERLLNAMRGDNRSKKRTDTLIYGFDSGWTSFNIGVYGPMILRARGTITSYSLSSGPNGVTSGSRAEQIKQDPQGNNVVAPSAPYLALVGRLCRQGGCTDPFFVGSDTLLCPDKLGTGELQLWTNNIVADNGSRLTIWFGASTGSFNFETSPASSTACATNSLPNISEEAQALAAGRVIRKQNFVVSSRNLDWAAYFFPVDKPFRIKAWGEMQPMKQSRYISDPSGWHGDTPFLNNVNDLVLPKVPYQALIGRLCDVDESCTEPFLVGAGKTVCPDRRHLDHLELWFNEHGHRGLDNQFVKLNQLSRPQDRWGEYRFEVSSAPVGSNCPSSIQ